MTNETEQEDLRGETALDIATRWLQQGMASTFPKQAKVCQELLKLDKIVSVIHDVLIVSWINPDVLYTDTRKAINDLIAMEVDMALDPRVSREAAALQEQGARDAWDQILEVISKYRDVHLNEIRNGGFNHDDEV